MLEEIGITAIRIYKKSVTTFKYSDGITQMMSYSQPLPSILEDSHYEDPTHWQGALVLDMSPICYCAFACLPMMDPGLKPNEVDPYTGSSIIEEIPDAKGADVKVGEYCALDKVGTEVYAQIVKKLGGRVGIVYDRKIYWED